MKTMDLVPMPGVFVNPGAGPLLVKTSPKHAETNVKVLAKDAFPRKKVAIQRRRDFDSDGRYGFLVNGTEVLMPGLPLEEVRWLRLPEQNIWDFPRLYIDGSSWVWYYAINALRGR